MKPKQITMAVRRSMPIKYLMREEIGIGPYIDIDTGKQEFKEYVAKSVAKRILKDFDKLVEYRNEKVEGLFYQEARLVIMGDDTEYENEKDG